MTIQLHQLQFFCHHGLFKEEKLHGGTFIVNIDIAVTDPATIIIHISDTINYVEIYELVKARMMQPTPLLETLVMDIANQILYYSSLIKNVRVDITKAAAPITNFQGTAGVSYFKERD